MRKKIININIFKEFYNTNTTKRNSVKMKKMYAILIYSFKEVPQHSLQHVQQLLQNALPAQQAALIATLKHIFILLFLVYFR